MNDIQLKGEPTMAKAKKAKPAKKTAKGGKKKPGHKGNGQGKDKT